MSHGIDALSPKANKGSVTLDSFELPGVCERAEQTKLSPLTLLGVKIYTYR